ncbi:hypothetical protein P4O66_008898, partial [Electrophorus voltai]
SLESTRRMLQLVEEVILIISGFVMVRCASAHLLTVDASGGGEESKKVEETQQSEQPAVTSPGWAESGERVGKSRPQQTLRELRCFLKLCDATFSRYSQTEQGSTGKITSLNATEFAQYAVTVEGMQASESQYVQRS